MPATNKHTKYEKCHFFCVLLDARCVHRFLALLLWYAIFCFISLALEHKKRHGVHIARQHVPFSYSTELISSWSTKPSATFQFTRLLQIHIKVELGAEGKWRKKKKTYPCQCLCDYAKFWWMFFFSSFTLLLSSLDTNNFCVTFWSFNKKKYVPLPRYLYIICEYACSRWDADFLWKCTNAFVLSILDICWMCIYFTFLIWMSCAYIFSHSNSHFRSMFWLFLAMQWARHQCLLLYQHNK